MSFNFRCAGGVTTWLDMHTVKINGMRTNGHGKLDLHHSFLKCCWPQIYLYYIPDNILMADSQWPCLKNSLKRWRRKETNSIFDQG